MSSSDSSSSAWPALAYADWADTCNTLHLWTQVVGKVKLRLAPFSNHWWGIVLFVTARGLTTGAMPYGERVLQIDFDFCAHELILRTSDAREQRIRLEPIATADFYAAVMAGLSALDVDVRIWTMPGEIEGAIPFDQDRVHASYDGAAAKTFWRQLVQAVMQEAYSHECQSLGFWPGNGGYGRAAFYAYAYPEPDGFGAQPVRPQGAAYNADVGQFLLDYDAVRTAVSPDDALLDFAQSTYEAAVNRGEWERKGLER